MIKTNMHYKLWCKEKGLNPIQSGNIEKFIKDDNVFYSESEGEIFIDKGNEMIEWKDGLFYHESQCVSDWAIDDDLVDITFYRKLKN